VNYLAQQVMESNGRLPEITPPPATVGSGNPTPAPPPTTP